MLMDLKHSKGIKDGVFDDLLYAMHYYLLPEGNLLPPSLYLMEKIIEVLHPDACEWHACPAEKCKPWGPTPRSKWPEHRYDKCACGLYRFIDPNATKPNGDLHLEPAKVGCGTRPYNVESRPHMSAYSQCHSHNHTSHMHLQLCCSAE